MVSFVCLFLFRSFVCLFVRSFVRSFIGLLVRSFINAYRLQAVIRSQHPFKLGARPFRPPALNFRPGPTLSLNLRDGDLVNGCMHTLIERDGLHALEEPRRVRN